MRRKDWPERLAAVVAAGKKKPFRPGRHDCFIFVCDAIAALTDDDPGRGWRSAYRSVRRGQEMMRAAGFDDHVDYLTRGRAETPMAFARRGDIAIVPTPEGEATGIVDGTTILTVPVGGDVRHVPLSDGLRFYEVT